LLVSGAGKVSPTDKVVGEIVGFYGFLGPVFSAGGGKWPWRFDRPQIVIYIRLGRGLSPHSALGESTEAIITLPG
jgi:hypothetical protein